MTKTDLIIAAGSDRSYEDFVKIKETFPCMGRMAFSTDIRVQKDKTGVGADAVSIVTSTATAYIPLEELVDRDKEIARLTAESKKMDSEIKRSEGMLGNPNFLNKAPEAKVREEQEKLVKYRAMKQKLTEQLNAYGV